MSDQTENTPYYQGGPSGKDREQGCDPPPPPPTPPPTCPDPCDKRPPWGPPDIRPECCPTDERACCPKKDQYCTWDEVDDPCVRASSCGKPWTKIECKCESLNKDCKCDEWDCGSYPQGTCVPCYPCEGLFPDGPDGGTDDSNGGSDEPTGDGCVGELREELSKLRKEISAQQNEKTTIEGKIKTGQELEKELAKLVQDFQGAIDKYTTERPKLVCREECLKIFYRDTAKTFEDRQTFPEACLKDFRTAINEELCKLEQKRCCQKNLEGKLEKVTKLIWEQTQAANNFKKADDAFKAIKDFPKWVDDQFKPLDTLKDQISSALNDKDPLKQRWAFYLFYWRFAPGLCKRFPIAICCEETRDEFDPGGCEVAFVK